MDSGSQVLTFDAFDGGRHGTVSYELSAIRSARWTPAEDELADLEIRLHDGSVRLHKVHVKAAINVCERAGTG